jgi:hypothetical protein
MTCRYRGTTVLFRKNILPPSPGWKGYTDNESCKTVICIHKLLGVTSPQTVIFNYIPSLEPHWQIRGYNLTVYNFSLRYHYSGWDCKHHVSRAHFKGENNDTIKYSVLKYFYVYRHKRYNIFMVKFYENSHN